MLHKLHHHWEVSSRREFFTRAGSGLAGMRGIHPVRDDGVIRPLLEIAPELRHPGTREALSKCLVRVAGQRVRRL